MWWSWSSPAPPLAGPPSRGLSENRLPTTRHRGRRWPSYVPLQGPLPEAHVLSLSEEQGVSLSTTLQLLLLLLLLQLAHSLVRRQMELQKHSRVPHIHVVAVFLFAENEVFVACRQLRRRGRRGGRPQKSARSTALQESLQLSFTISNVVISGATGRLWVGNEKEPRLHEGNTV